MLDGRILDALDVMGRIIRGESNKANKKIPFGGLQVRSPGSSPRESALLIQAALS